MNAVSYGRTSEEPLKVERDLGVTWCGAVKCARKAERRPLQPSPSQH